MRPATQDEPGGFSLFGGILPRRFVTESPTMTTRAELDALQSRWRQDIQFTQPVLGRPLHFTSTWGLFSPEQLDEGSLMLLDHIAFRAADHSIDLGCGYGVLGMTAARECPQGQHLLIDKDFVAVDYARRNCAANGLGNAEVQLSNGFLQVDRARRFDLVMRLSDAQRSPGNLSSLLIETPNGHVPLSQLATIEENDGPNQISRENARRRIVISANTDGRDIAQVVQAIRQTLDAKPLPEGYFTALEGQFQAQEQAAKLMSVLAVVSLALIFMVLYSRYRSVTLTAIIMGNIPLALVGSVVALWLSGQPLSVAALVGFITLTGIATRNGILKISHYINLCMQEGETFSQAMIIRGSLERLTPVLMTALVAAFALVPLLLSANAPGKEILHPVAVVIFGGLISSTLLDTILTPVMFWLWGRQPLARLLAQHQGDSF